MATTSLRTCHRAKMLPRGLLSPVRIKCSCNFRTLASGSVVGVGEGTWFSKNDPNCILTPFPNSKWIEEILFKISKNILLWAKISSGRSHAHL